jgi:predicted nucleotidyltransferase
VNTKSDSAGRPASPDSNDLAIAREFARALAECYDPSEFDVILFGSRARGDAEEESDVDIFVALRRDDPAGAVERAALQIACDLTLEHGVLVSPLVADLAYLKRHEGFSLLESIAEEGVRV